MLNKDILGLNPSKLMYINLELRKFGKPCNYGNGYIEYKEEFVDYDNYYPLWFSKLFNIKKTYKAGYRDNLNKYHEINENYSILTNFPIRTTPENSLYMDVDGKLCRRHVLTITYYFSNNNNETTTIKRVVEKYFNTLEDVGEYEINLIQEYQDNGIEVLSCWE